MAKISILKYTKLFGSVRYINDNTNISYARTPKDEMQFIRENTIYSFADVADTAAPIHQNVQSADKIRKILNKLHWLVVICILISAILFVTFLLTDKNAPYYMLIKNLGCLGMFQIITSPFQFILVGLVTDKPVKDFCRKLTAATSRMYHLQSGTIAVLNDHYDHHTGKHRPVVGKLQTSYENRVLQNLQRSAEILLNKDILTSNLAETSSQPCIQGDEVFPFATCTYIQSISDIKENSKQDMLTVTCSGIRYMIYYPTATGHSGTVGASPFLTYGELYFHNEKLYLPKRIIDSERYMNALNNLKNK